MTDRGRLLIGNLAGEIELARASTTGRHPDLGAAAARKVAAAASHMALLARPGDRLWLPSPVPAEELCAAARELGAIESGRLEDVEPAGEVCAWAETASVARLRQPRGAAEEDVSAMARGRDWRAALWHLRASPEVVGAVNHRSFALGLALERGWALPGARMVSDVGEIERHLATGAADAGSEQAWVVKAPYSAAGRERLRHRGAEMGRGERVRIERMLTRFGQLLFEPWVARLDDVACCGLVHPGGTRIFASHRLDNDPRGVFRAAIIDDNGDGDEEIRDALQAAAMSAGEALAKAGYLGPFSVDAYTWRDPGGTIHLQRMSEINARLSFGLMARLAAENAGCPSGPFELRL